MSSDETHPCICEDDGGALCPRHDIFVFLCGVCGIKDDTPHTPIDHPWLLKGYSHGHCREIKEQRDLLIIALQKTLGHLDMISPSGWHVEQARSTIIKVLEDAGS